jgi:hypothetical protein
VIVLLQTRLVSTDKENANLNDQNFFYKNFAQTLERLQANLSWKEESSAVNVTFDDTQNLVEMCYFELNTNASSDFCDLFIDNVHILYGYTRMKEYPYVETCGLDEKLPTEIDFFWSWEKHVNVET